MNRALHRRRAALALLVIGLPFLVLLGLSLVLTRQERVLARTHAQEERQRLVEMVSRRLRERLQAVRLQVAAGLSPIPELAFIGRREGGALVAPWEEPKNVSLSSAARAEVDAGRRAELVENRPAEARRHYQTALDRARTPEEQAYTRLLLARTLLKSGREKEALAEYEQLARSSPEMVDDQGIPFALYGAERLVALRASGTVALGAMEVVLHHRDAISPAAIYLIRGAAENLSTSADPQLRSRAESVLSAAALRLESVEQILELKQQVDRILPRSAGGSPAEGWVTFGDPLWLVASGPSREGEAVYAVAADVLAREIRSEDPTLGVFHLTSGWGPGGEALGAAFPGLRVQLDSAAPLAGEQRLIASRKFVAASLAAVLAATLAAAWLLWRDVRREVRVTELRAQFVSSVSHELRTPLSAIRMYAESLRMGRPADSQARKEYLDTIINESERLSRLLDNVLEFSKIERGERHYRIEPADLAQVVRSAGRAIDYSLQQRGFRLELDLDHAIPPVKADSDAIEQAVLNLLTNAMKYSGESRRIELSLEPSNGHAVIRVRDHGIGIDPAEQPRIFEKYYRAPNAIHTTGAGLGLSIVAHIARAHGGQLAVESEPGKGSTFSLALPLEDR
ncbi:MAG TPA: ATP-binding protein [Thermoanaerobaculia bacterium]|nr:ATP-binding protein [Thermoanaerobaculia bacterium]